MERSKSQNKISFLNYAASGVLVCLWMFVMMGFGRTAGTIPLEILLGNPERARAQVSPQGDRLAYLRSVHGVLNVWVQELSFQKEWQVTKDTNRGITHYAWDPREKAILYIQDKDGDENWHLYSTDIQTGQIKDLTPFPGVQAQIIDINPYYPDEILIGLNKENPKHHDAYRLNLRSGVLTLLARNNGKVSQWVADRNTQIRVALQMRDEGGYAVYYREDPQGNDWRLLFVWGLEDSLSSSVVGFSSDGWKLYLIDSRGSDTAGLVEYNVETGDMREILRDPQFDVSTVILDVETFQPRMVSIRREKNEWEGLDEQSRKTLEFFDRRFDGEKNFHNRSFDGRYWVISHEKDTAPVAYYLFDQNKPELTFLFSHQPDLEKFKLHPMKPIKILSRDGIELYGYLTLPHGERQENLPLVILIHGGPWTRDRWGFNPLAQWLADRGMACLQINFRGSTGFGKSFVNAGNREWGGKMLEDILDAKNWAVQAGIADSKRIAVMGASYGGYAALSAAAFYPDDFTCAVDFFGPSNLITLIENMPPYWSSEKRNIELRIGNPKDDREFLMSRSPFFHAEQIKIPVFIAQGANDPRVPRSESDEMVARLKSNRTPVVYELISGEGHGFLKASTRIKVYKKAESFLRDCLKGV